MTDEIIQKAQEKPLWVMRGVADSGDVRVVVQAGQDESVNVVKSWAERIARDIERTGQAFVPSGYAVQIYTPNFNCSYPEEPHDKQVIVHHAVESGIELRDDGVEKLSIEAMESEPLLAEDGSAEKPENIVIKYESGHETMERAKKAAMAMLERFRLQPDLCGGIWPTTEENTKQAPTEKTVEWRHTGPDVCRYAKPVPVGDAREPWTGKVVPMPEWVVPRDARLNRERIHRDNWGDGEEPDSDPLQRRREKLRLIEALIMKARAWVQRHHKWPLCNVHGEPVDLVPIRGTWDVEMKWVCLKCGGGR